MFQRKQGICLVPEDGKGSLGNKSSEVGSGPEGLPVPVLRSAPSVKVNTLWLERKAARA